MKDVTRLAAEEYIQANVSTNRDDLMEVRRLLEKAKRYMLALEDELQERDAAPVAQIPDPAHIPCPYCTGKMPAYGSPVLPDHRPWCRMVFPGTDDTTVEIQQRYQAILLYVDLREAYIDRESIDNGGFHSAPVMEQWISCETDGMRRAAELLLADLTEYEPIAFRTGLEEVWAEWINKIVQPW